MIQLVKLNLLPYRELEKQRLLKQLKTILALCALVGVVLTGLGWFVLNRANSNQDDRNEYLKTQTAILDKQIAQVKDLETQKKNFLDRKKKIEELQSDRSKLARIMNDLNRMLPDGVYITGIQPDASNGYIINGRAVSDSKIAILMRNLPSTGIFQLPELKSIKKDNDAQSFSLAAKFVNVPSNGAKPTASGSVLDQGAPKNGK